MSTDEGALVLFSGGQDSTTCLAWALERFDRVETVGFDYGQRHRIELDCRDPIRSAIIEIRPGWKARLHQDHTINIGSLGELSETALTRDVAIKIERNGLPSTFVPGRNLIFLTFAAALAYRRGLRHLVGGMCETDYSGYPDCRDDTIKAIQIALNLGLQHRFVLHTPLMWIDKAATWRLGESLGGSKLVDLIINQTHTCYFGTRGECHPWGYGCGKCPACELRAQGYDRYRAAVIIQQPLDRDFFRAEPQ
jgi:7-cyano-7-deazaguanine synthase